MEMGTRWRARLERHCALVPCEPAATASITIMEIVDDAIMLVIPGAMNAGLASVLF